MVRIEGTDFAERVLVRFGDTEARIVSSGIREGISTLNVRTPAHAPGVVDVSVVNLDPNGSPMPGEQVVLADGYRFLRPRIVQESDLTRLVRTLIRKLRIQVLANTSISVSVDYDDTVVDGQNIVAISKLPSLVLSGPGLSENRFFSTNELREDVVAGTSGLEVVRHRPPFTTDLSFTITAASDRTTELLNLMAAVATFLNRSRWIEMPRDPEIPGSEVVRWEMDPNRDFRTRLDISDDIRVFTCGFVIRGFDVDEGLPLDAGRLVEQTNIETEPLGADTLG